MKTLRLAVLVSGRGSNLQALIDACKDPAFPAAIAVVISNTPHAAGLARAAAADIPAMIVDHTYFKGDKAGFEGALAATIAQHGADLVCLAGFMRILGQGFLDRFPDRVINIHPSLLPAHKGLDTHEAVLKAGDREHGCSVHLVTAGMDEGPVIAQRRVPVKKGDTAETLAARVLAEEHALYPEVIKNIAEGRVVIRHGRIESGPAIRHHKPVTQESEVFMAQPPTQAHQHQAAPVADEDAVRRSHEAWGAFTKGSLIAGGAVAVTLVLMALFLA